jgi:hypothetical protein
MTGPQRMQNALLMDTQSGVKHLHRWEAVESPGSRAWPPGQALRGPPDGGHLRCSPILQIKAGRGVLMKQTNNQSCCAQCEKPGWSQEPQNA